MDIHSVIKETQKLSVPHRPKGVAWAPYFWRKHRFLGVFAKDKSSLTVFSDASEPF